MATKINEFMEKFKDWFGLVTSHRVGLIGTYLVSVSSIVVPIFISLNLLDLIDNPYFGVFTYLVLPVFFMGGLVMIPLGYYLHKREAIHVHKQLPMLNLNIAEHRFRLLLFIILTVVNVMIIGLASYGGLKYMDTVSFCGKVCHSVMEPEYTSYQDSPHSRVKCTQCHIGPGAPWFVRSKISGLAEVVSTVLNIYEKPHHQPVTNLRPARHTCEQCHWPDKFHGGRLKIIEMFKDNEKNTPYYTVLRVKVGGKEMHSGQHQGIHWHVSRANTIHYKALDKKREKIGWVEVKKGKETVIYTNQAYDKLSKEKKDELEIREMDCIDCHNRPTHVFYTPSKGVDKAISSNLIDQNLPFIKREAVKAITFNYGNMKKELVKQEIEKKIIKFYKDNYTQKFDAWKAKIEQAGKSIANVYDRNVFPLMNVTWNTYTNHLGHQNDLGCFRCHDSEHLSQKDKSKYITQDCSTCHDRMVEEEEDRSKVDKLFNLR